MMMGRVMNALNFWMEAGMMICRRNECTKLLEGGRNDDGATSSV